MKSEKERLEKRRAYNKKNRDKINKQAQDRRQRNPERFKEYARKYYHQHSEIWNTPYFDLKMEIHTKLSKIHSNSDIPCCNCCGENSHHSFLTIDHISGRKAIGHGREMKGTKLLYYLKKNGVDAKNFQILCWNCNSAKSFLGVCYHKS